MHDPGGCAPPHLVTCGGVLLPRLYEQVTSARDSLNPVCKELYLVDADFEKIFGMGKKEFYSMRLWRQRQAARVAASLSLRQPS